MHSLVELCCGMLEQSSLYVCGDTEPPCLKYYKAYMPLILKLRLGYVVENFLDLVQPERDELLCPELDYLQALVEEKLVIRYQFTVVLKIIISLLSTLLSHLCCIESHHTILNFQK